MTTAIKGCFSTEKKNLSRQPEIDIAKGFSILFMVFCHVFETLVYYFDPEQSIAFSEGFLDNILGGSLSAPVFMFFMGISLCYSKRAGAGDLLMRALKMMGAIVILELCRTGVPGLIEWLLYQDPESLEYTVCMLFCADIMQFAVLAFLLDRKSVV